MVRVGLCDIVGLRSLTRAGHAKVHLGHGSSSIGKTHGRSGSGGIGRRRRSADRWRCCGMTDEVDLVLSISRPEVDGDDKIARINFPRMNRYRERRLQLHNIWFCTSTEYSLIFHLFVGTRTADDQTNARRWCDWPSVLHQVRDRQLMLDLTGRILRQWPVEACRAFLHLPCRQIRTYVREQEPALPEVCQMISFKFG